MRRQTVRQRATLALSIGFVALSACVSEPTFNGTVLEPPIAAPELAKDTLGLMVEYGEPLDEPGADGSYHVDHTSSYFVVDRSGQAPSKYVTPGYACYRASALST